jgi:[ribosomal protein S5]-alanine N-acetyltransferase
LETGCLHNARMILETERLILDTWQSSDWTAFRPIATDPEVMRYITGGVPWTDDQIRNFVDRQVKLYSERGFCRWKLLDKTTGELIGFCGVGFWREAPDPEIGWWLARRYWGRGLATEAAQTALRDAFERVRLERIISVAMPENTASIRIMQKLGLEFDCEFENEGVRLVRYAIGRSQYFSRVDTLTRPAPADESVGCEPPSPPRGRGLESE